MSQLKHCLMATAGLVMLITAVATLNALNGDGISPHGSVHALFDLSAPVNGPFPSDWFTVADISHNSGRRIIHPEPARFFEVPIQGPQPEDLNYIP
jgi:hypothetical protein